MFQAFEEQQSRCRSDVSLYMYGLGWIKSWAPFTRSSRDTLTCFVWRHPDFDPLPRIATYMNEQTYLHTYLPTYIHTYIHAYMHTCEHVILLYMYTCACLAQTRHDTTTSNLPEPPPVKMRLPNKQGQTKMTSTQFVKEKVRAQDGDVSNRPAN